MIIDPNSRFIFDRPLVLACGCFDILTVGHVRHLKAAKRLSKRLCVLITADEFVNKPGRPILSENDRAEVVDALGCVDFTVINPYPTAVQSILHFRPNVYVKGKEYRTIRTTEMLKEIEAVESVGGRMEFTDTDGLHTTEVIDSVEHYIRDIRMG